MKLLERMQRDNIPVTWATIREGWRGVGDYMRLLTLDEIAEYATERLRRGPATQEEAFLAGVESSYESEVGELVERLASGEDADNEMEKRKWRLVLLESIMDDLSDDPLYGSIALVEFWSKWGFPDDGPLGKPSKINRDDFSKEGFISMRQNHLRWIQGELRGLRS